MPGGRVEDRSYGVPTGFFYGILSPAPFGFKIYALVIFLHICNLGRIQILSETVEKP
jgi:hypothetical protein